MFLSVLQPQISSTNRSSRAISSLILLSCLSRTSQEKIGCHISPQSMFGAGWISVEITTTDRSCKISPLKRQQTAYIKTTQLRSCLRKKGNRVETERDGTRAETRFGFPAKRKSPFISAGVSVHSAAGSRGVGISGSNAG